MTDDTIDDTIDCSDLAIPKRRCGKQSAASQAAYEAKLALWCDGIKQIQSTLDFAVSSRGWCYQLESHGLSKGDFNGAQRLINDCRKSGSLPLNICCDDDRRAAENLEDLNEADPEDEAEIIVEYVTNAERYYYPFSFWDDKKYYVEVVVEKVDLKSLFKKVCAPFHIAIANFAGWGDLNGRAAMMKRFKYWQARGKKCVLLYCGDHDPGGEHITKFLRSNLEDMADAVGWWPDDLIIERFGLNYDFIEANNLTWIDNLDTGRGGSLADPAHADHNKPYVQEYIAKYGVRKVEANALVVRPEEGRELCRQAILKYLPEDAPEQYQSALELPRSELRTAIRRLMAEAE